MSIASFQPLPAGFFCILDLFARAGSIASGLSDGSNGSQVVFLENETPSPKWGGVLDFRGETIPTRAQRVPSTHKFQQPHFGFLFLGSPNTVVIGHVYAEFCFLFPPPEWRIPMPITLCVATCSQDMGTRFPAFRGIVEESGSRFSTHTSDQPCDMLGGGLC